jgi:hypothetical protein
VLPLWGWEQGAMEKVINEFRVIETDDGFRIEIKGDKEAILTCPRGLVVHLE